MLKKVNFRALLGGGMVFLGVLLLLEKANILRFRASEFFWGAILLAAGAMFLGNFFQNTRRSWWAILPALTLFGMAADAFLPASLEAWSGVFFLGGLGLAFIIVYVNDHARWWAVIPGGVLLTLASLSLLGEAASGGLFFVGLGLTFFAVALLPNPITNTRWAYIPGAILFLMGALMGVPQISGLGAYLWPLALIMGGLGLIAGFFLRQKG